MLIAFLFQTFLLVNANSECSLKVSLIEGSQSEVQAILEIQGKRLSLEVDSFSAQIRKCEALATRDYYLLEIALGSTGTTSDRAETKMILIKNANDKLIKVYEQTISYQTTRFENGEKKVSAKSFPYKLSTNDKKIVVTNVATKEKKEFPF